MSAFGGKADVLKGWVLCLLMTQSGYYQPRHVERLPTRKEASAMLTLHFLCACDAFWPL